jgi:ribose 5-phosphate isomerase RpiB
LKIAVINETSSADKNTDILAALAGRGHDVFNVGMVKSAATPELTYIHTGFLSALLLNLFRADFIVGGCGTGQGFLNSVMQYPGVICGHITTPLDGWLFTQINGGNCISLALNQGYGWAGEVNLRFIFDRIFSVERGCGYPPQRQASQKQSIKTLQLVDQVTHKSMSDILSDLPDEVIKPALNYPGVIDVLDLESTGNEKMKVLLKKRISEWAY